MSLWEKWETAFSGDSQREEPTGLERVDKKKTDDVLAIFYQVGKSKKK